jgi:hypothetical protein
VFEWGIGNAIKLQKANSAYWWCNCLNRYEEWEWRMGIGNGEWKWGNGNGEWEWE